MKITSNHRLDLEGGDEFKYTFQKSPNFNNRLKTVNMLIIHATEGPNVAAAVNVFTQPGTSTHLVLGKDGKELCQLVGFNLAGVHANEYNDASIGIELDYPGDVRQGDMPPYKALRSYQENQYLVARDLNDFQSKFWPLYPKVQLDALFSVCKKLVEQYPTITSIFGHEELKSFKMDPGPAFPIAQFRSKLFGTKAILQETVRDVQIHSQPSATSTLLTTASIKAHTPVVITNETADWVLVQVMAEIEGNPWIVGWVESSAVKIHWEPPMVNLSHRLSTQAGQLFRFVELPAENFNAKKNITQHKYVIMHITTGTNMDSTINFFKNKVNQVSAHLLVGRAGQVVQFVPFDKIAYHAGFSWWEGDKNLNDLSIGIELDNAGFLNNFQGKWMRGRIEIPKNQVKLATHWKETKERAWQDFTQIQLDVTLDILKVLKDRYGIEEILGHDQVNMKNRVDPGPLFPIEEFRAQLFPGRRLPIIKEFQITQETKLYVNVNQKPPDLSQLSSKETLEAGTQVTIEKAVDDWILIKVVKDSRRGWIKKGSVQPTNDIKKHKVTAPVSFYKPLAAPPPSVLLNKSFPAGTGIRLQEDQKDWVLVVLLDPFKGLEGWIKKEVTNISR